MTSKSVAAPRQAVINPFGYPGLKVVAYQAISVTKYDNGTRRASHSRLDLATHRMLFTALSTPSEDWDCAYPTQHDLVAAALEALEDAHAQEQLF